MNSSSSYNDPMHNWLPLSVNKRLSTLRAQQMCQYLERTVWKIAMTMLSRIDRLTYSLDLVAAAKNLEVGKLTLKPCEQKLDRYVCRTVLTFNKDHCVRYENRFVIFKILSIIEEIAFIQMFVKYDTKTTT